MITIRSTCMEHGDITIGGDDVLLGWSVYVIGCPQGHMIIRDLNPQLESVLKGCQVEQLGT